MKKAIVETATGRVLNVILIEPASSGGFEAWHCPEDCQLIDVGPYAQPGAIWDGVQFISTVHTPPRKDVLMEKLWVNVDTPDVMKSHDLTQAHIDELQSILAQARIKGTITPNELAMLERLERGAIKPTYDREIIRRVMGDGYVHPT